MNADKAEKLGSLFLAVFCVGLTAQFASVGMLNGEQWIGALLASLGSVTFAVTVRVWPRDDLAPARVRARD